MIQIFWPPQKKTTKKTQQQQQKKWQTQKPSRTHLAELSLNSSKVLKSSESNFLAACFFY